ncbi:GvpL/GvpF family gas vesicle protein [Dactylosporangium sp. McL0621]|uniref:GvpL/GvpF family gas vesicle protein n=1 Tax=Dactylosporangium sp. McL0621 TaxID=3415678 RepID=UPI003CEBACE3
MSDGIWLHAVARDLAPGAIDDCEAVAGGDLRTVSGADLVAVVSPVDLDEFGEDALRRNLEDLAWLDRIARAHHSVVAALAREHAVVPAGLATVYRDDAGLRTMLEQRRGDLDAVLERVGDRAEWGVKAYAAPETEAPPATPAASAHSAGPSGDRHTAGDRANRPGTEAADSGGAPGDRRGAGDLADRPGTAYLSRRRARLSAGEVWRQRATDGAEATYAALAAGAAEARRHPPQDPRLTGRTEPMVLNGAFLVDRAGSDGFAGLVAAEAARHPELHLELTGPWPPYSFAAAEETPP